MARLRFWEIPGECKLTAEIDALIGIGVTSDLISTTDYAQWIRWIYGVKTWDVAIDLTSPDPFVLSFAFGLSDGQGGNTLSIMDERMKVCGYPSYTIAGDGPSSSTMATVLGGAVRDNNPNFLFLMGFKLTWGATGYVFATNASDISGGSHGSVVTCSFDGIPVGLFCNAGGVGTTGTIVFTPSSFWEYARFDGTFPQYDSTDGSLIGDPNSLEFKAEI